VADVGGKVPAQGPYVVQSLLATLILLVILCALDITIHPIIVTALASTTFILFAQPHGVAAKPRSVMAGHALGVLSGVTCSLLWAQSPSLPVHQEAMLHLAFSAIAVGLAIALMVVADAPHPPAAGTALAMALNPLGWRTVAFVLVSAACLSLARWLLRSRLTDLY
jgi:CBS-domain-containing membrane protein